VNHHARAYRFEFGNVPQPMFAEKEPIIQNHVIPASQQFTGKSSDDLAAREHAANMLGMLDFIE